MYVYSVILRWGCFIELVAYASSYVNFQEAFIFLCLSRYVSYVWETNDLFLGISNYCPLHHYIHWWFDHSPWLDLIGLVLILFPSIYLFLSWYFIRLTYIVLCSYQFTFRVRYFPHIILIHPISSSIFFISSLSSLIYSSLIFSSSLIYSYWTSSDPWLMWLSTYIAFYTWGYGILSLGLLSLVSIHFFTFLP